MEAFVVTYNGHISTEGYKSFEGAVAFIEGRGGINKFKAETPSLYTDGKNTYKIHHIRLKA